MPINRKNKVIFIHIPKTGGYSIYKIFDMKPPFEGENEGMGHQTSANHKSKFKRKWDGYFKFAFVRNPWERFISAYMYHRKLYDKNVNAQIGARKLCNTYPDVNKLIDAMRKDESICKSIINNTHFREQWKWLTEPVDFIGSVENFTEDIHKILDKLGIEPYPEIPQENTTKHGGAEILSIKNRKFLTQLYSKDIKLFKLSYPQ